MEIADQRMQKLEKNLKQTQNYLDLLKIIA